MTNAKSKTTEEYLEELEIREKLCTEQLENLERQEKRNAGQGKTEKDLAKVKAERRRLARIRGLIKRIREAADHRMETPEKFLEQRNGAGGQEIEIPENHIHGGTKNEKN